VFRVPDVAYFQDSGSLCTRLAPQAPLLLLYLTPRSLPSGIPPVARNGKRGAGGFGKSP